MKNTQITFKIHSTVSHRWEREERLYAINELVVQCRQASITSKQLFDSLERIELLTYQSAAFLESNRESIINGQILTNESIFQCTCPLTALTHNTDCIYYPPSPQEIYKQCL